MKIQYAYAASEKAESYGLGDQGCFFIEIDRTDSLAATELKELIGMAYDYGILEIEIPTSFLLTTWR